MDYMVPDAVWEMTTIHFESWRFSAYPEGLKST